MTTPPNQPTPPTPGPFTRGTPKPRPAPFRAPLNANDDRSDHIPPDDAVHRAQLDALSPARPARRDPTPPPPPREGSREQPRYRSWDGELTEGQDEVMQAAEPDAEPGSDLTL